MYLWDAAFDFQHNYPSYMRSPSVYAMVSMLRNVVITCWPQFKYSFSLQVNQDAPPPGLGVQDDEVDKVSQAITIVDMTDKLDQLFKDFGAKLNNYIEIRGCTSLMCLETESCEMYSD